MKSKIPKKPSTKLRDTHVIANPFLDSLGRYVHICFCGYHFGIVHPSTLYSKNHCGERCLNIRRVYFGPRQVDSEKIMETIHAQEKLSRSNPTIHLTPFEDKEKKYFWVLDRGEHIYFLRPKKAHLVGEIEQEHKLIDLSNLLLSNNFKPYFVE